MPVRFLLDPDIVGGINKDAIQRHSSDGVMSEEVLRGLVREGCFVRIVW